MTTAGRFEGSDQPTQVKINNDVILRNIVLGEPREDDSKILMQVVLIKNNIFDVQHG